MVIVFWLLGAAIVFAIAAIAVGRVTAALARSPARALYDLEESVEFVAEALPHQLTAELSYDDVRLILRLFHDYLHERGVATVAGEDDGTGEPAVVDPAEVVDYVLWRAALAERSVRRSDAEAVIEAQLAYFDAIGVLGQPLRDPDDPPAPGTGA